MGHKGRPFGFIHDIRLAYFKFGNCDWFYPNPGYSEVMVKRSGWRFDGQMFYKSAPNYKKEVDNG